MEVDISIGKALVVLGIMLIIGVMVFGTVDGAISRTSWTTAMNTTHDSVVNNILTSFTLAGVAAIVVGAAFIMRNLAF